MGRQTAGDAHDRLRSRSPPFGRQRASLTAAARGAGLCHGLATAAESDGPS
jgi:hypothetical protein